jgi:hypothetical protein
MKPKTFRELFANTGIEPTIDENGNTQYSFKANMKQETLEETAEKEYPKCIIENPSCNGYNEPDYIDINEEYRDTFIAGAEWQAERMYSKEDMIEFAFNAYYNISELMGVPFNLISENRGNIEDYYDKQFENE